MISIIICSRNGALLNAVSENVAKTIGVPYEIIAVDNSAGQYGICAAYNIGARQSRFDVLCFMHEDILFHTFNWGAVIKEIFSDEHIGLVGVIGSKYLVDAPAAWWGGGLELCRRNILEGYADKTQERVLQNPENEEFADVVAVDGLWLCTRKTVWQEHPFDEKTFTDFHFYDVDFSAQVFRKYRVVVTYNILLEHFSRGNINHAWVKSALAFVKKWDEHLPMTTVEVGGKEARRIRKLAYQAFVSRLISLNYDKRVTLKYVLKNLSFDYFNKDNLWLLKQFIKHYH